MGITKEALVLPSASALRFWACRISSTVRTGTAPSGDLERRLEGVGDMLRVPFAMLALVTLSGFVDSGLGSASLRETCAADADAEALAGLGTEDGLTLTAALLGGDTTGGPACRMGARSLLSPRSFSNNPQILVF